MRMTLIKYLLLGLLLLLISSSIALPIVMETMIERSLRETVQAEEISANVHNGHGRMDIPLGLVGGIADRISVSGRNVQIGKLLCSRVDVWADNVDVDMSRLIDDGKLLFQHLGDAEVIAEVKEEELAKTLEQSVEKLSNVSVNITPSGIEAEGDYTLGKLPVRIFLTGQLVGRGDKIYFVSERVTLQHTIGKISANFKTDALLADLSTLPFAVRVADIRPFDGVVSIRVEKEDTVMEQKTQ